MWSVGVTLYELYTGKIMFAGKSNNQMLKLFMDWKGKFSNRMIRKAAFKNNHFDSSYNFLYQEVDKLTEKEKTVVIANIKSIRDLRQELLNDQTMREEERKKVQHLTNLLEDILMLDPSKRLKVSEALAHKFFTEKI